ncbi:MAG: two-component regulator propeller domain-containing protein, partial [Acidobacteriota bacterium]
MLVVACAATASTLSPRFVNLSTDDGLSDNNVEAIVQDFQGFLWLGTSNGLNRYDGRELKVYRYDPDDPASLSGNFVLTLLVDRQGTLWAGARGLNRYVRETDTFERFVNDEADVRSLGDNNVHAMAEDPTGRLWIGTFWGLNLLNAEDGTFTRYEPVPEDPGAGPSGPRVRAVRASRDGIIWVGVQDGGLNRFDPATQRFVHYRHDPDDPSSLASDNVWDIFEDSAGSLWVATHRGLHRLDRESETFERYLHDPADPGSLPGDRTDAIFEDSRGLLWVATDGAGLAFRQIGEEARWTSLRREASDPKSLASDVVRTIFEDRIGDLWIGTYDGGVSFYNPDSSVFAVERQVENQADGLSDSRVLSFYQDEPDLDPHAGEALWVGTEGGLNLWNRADGTFK